MVLLEDERYVPNIGSASEDSVMMAPVLLVKVRGRDFHLSRSQIQSDAPNIFTSHLERAQAVGEPPSPLFLDRDPDIFALIVQYLSGYDILPIPPAAIPRTFTLESAKRALVRDAELLCLSGLRSAFQASFAPPAVFLRWTGLSSRATSLSDLLDSRIPLHGLFDNDDLAIPIHTCGFGIRFVPRSAFLVHGAKQTTYALGLSDSQIVYEIVDCERGPQTGLLIYGQSHQDAQYKVDGRVYEPSDVPVRTQILIDEAWMTCTRASLQSLNGKETRCIFLKLLTLEGRTRNNVIRTLDYHSITLDAEEATLRD